MRAADYLWSARVLARGGAGGGEEQVSATVALGRHMLWCRTRNLRPSTIDQRARALLRLSKAIDPVTLIDADHETLSVWWHGLTDRIEAESRACELSHVRAFYRWAVLEGVIDHDPTARLVRPKVPAGLPRPIPDTELITALEFASNPLRQWLLLAAYAGLRCGEIAQLKGEHLLLRQDPPIIVVDVSKGGHTSSVVVPPWLAEELGDYPAKGWLYRSTTGPGHVPAHRVSQIGNQFLHSLGINSTMHSLRHWFVTNTYRESARDLRQTQEAARHANVNTTQRYAWVDPGERGNIAARLPRHTQADTGRATRPVVALMTVLLLLVVAMCRPAPAAFGAVGVYYDPVPVETPPVRRRYDGQPGNKRVDPRLIGERGNGGSEAVDDDSDVVGGQLDDPSGQPPALSKVTTSTTSIVATGMVMPLPTSSPATEATTTTLRSSSCKIHPTVRHASGFCCAAFSADSQPEPRSVGSTHLTITSGPGSFGHSIFTPRAPRTPCPARTPARRGSAPSPHRTASRPPPRLQRRSPAASPPRSW